MKRDIYKRWIEKLLDPEIEQHFGALKMENMSGKCSFCALGVLADVAGLTFTGVRSGPGLIHCSAVRPGEEDQASFLPSDILSQSLQQLVYHTNDTLRSNFKHIVTVLDGWVVDGSLILED